MKICPVCNQTYTDDNLNFCLNDGATLDRQFDDAPPTVMLNKARTTQQNWGNYQTADPWQSQPLQQQQPFYPAVNQQSQNQTLPTLSIILGICSLLFLCCYGGFPFGAGALIVGLIGLKNANDNPMLYGGRGLAIGGIVTGVIGLLISVIMILIIVVSN